MDVSAHTVRRRLLSAGLRGCVAVKKPFISARNKKKRLQFARNHRNWTVDDWSRVLWSDELKFNMKVSDGAVYVRRRPGEELADCCTRKTVKHGGGNIMAWGCFAAAGVGRIHKVVAVMKKEQYVDILQNQMRPSMQDLFGDQHAVFMHDNDPKHTANLTKEWLNTNQYVVLTWPAQSPDLNPIENLWAILKQKRHDVDLRPSNEQQLWQVCREAWDLITPADCRKLVQSMPARIKAVIKAKGGATKY